MVVSVGWELIRFLYSGGSGVSMCGCEWKLCPSVAVVLGKRNLDARRTGLSTKAHALLACSYTVWLVPWLTLLLKSKGCGVYGVVDRDKDVEISKAINLSAVSLE